MEKERSNSLQEVSDLSLNKSETIDPRRFQVRDVNAKHDKRHLIQYASPETTINDNSSQSRYLGPVGRSYKGKKQSLLKRLSECSLSPCSDEFKFVMQGFKETEKEPNSTVYVATSKRTRIRKINNFSQGSKYPSVRLPSELGSALTFRVRPRGSSVPAGISETEPSGKARAAAQIHVPCSVHVKVAWQSLNVDLNFPVKNERRRHASLWDLPQKQLSEDRHEKNSEKKSSGTFRSDLEPVLSGKIDRLGLETLQWKKAEIELPKITERVFNDHNNLQIKLKETEISYENRRKGFTPAEQRNDEKRLMESDKVLVTHPQKERRYSGGNLTEGKNTASVKGKLRENTSSWEPCSTTENNFSRCTIDEESKNFAESHLIQAPLRRRTSQFAITRANVSRVGKAAEKASRLLKIHYRENGARKVITKEEKELDKLFEEMKDCRYLRKSTSSEMKI